MWNRKNEISRGVKNIRDLFQIISLIILTNSLIIFLKLLLNILNQLFSKFLSAQGFAIIHEACQVIGGVTAFK